jgi:RTX calcium-binding nonapeptide repeat (4 copies)
VIRRLKYGLAGSVLALGGLVLGSHAFASMGSASPLTGTTETVPKPKEPKTSECTIKGTARADRLHGTRRPEVICGLRGPDRITAGRRDLIIAGPGNDTIYARNGTANIIFGSAGRDRAYADRHDLLVNVEKRFLRRR